MPLRLLKAYLWLIAAFHLGVGLAVNLSHDLTRAIARGYGAEVEWTPQLNYIIRPLGALMIALGLIAAAAARDPLRYSAAVLGFVTLFTLGALQRIVFAAEVTSAFAITPTRNMANAVALLVQAAVLYLLWRAARPALRAV